jgi:hypothetical protein
MEGMYEKSLTVEGKTEDSLMMGCTMKKRLMMKSSMSEKGCRKVSHFLLVYKQGHDIATSLYLQPLPMESQR